MTQDEDEVPAKFPVAAWYWQMVVDAQTFVSAALQMPVECRPHDLAALLDYPLEDVIHYAYGGAYRLRQGQEDDFHDLFAWEGGKDPFPSGPVCDAVAWAQKLCDRICKRFGWDVLHDWATKSMGWMPESHDTFYRQLEAPYEKLSPLTLAEHAALRGLAAVLPLALEELGGPEAWARSGEHGSKLMFSQPMIAWIHSLKGKEHGPPPERPFPWVEHDLPYQARLDFFARLADYYGRVLKAEEDGRPVGDIPFLIKAHALAAVRDAPSEAATGYGHVKLHGRGMPAMVAGREKVLTAAGYKVAQKLVEVGALGITTEQLRSHVPSAGRILKGWLADEVWRAAILSPLEQGGRGAWKLREA